MMNGNGYRPFKITFLDINFWSWIIFWKNNDVKRAMFWMCGLWCRRRRQFCLCFSFMIYIKSLCKMSRIWAEGGRQTEALPRQTLARGNPTQDECSPSLFNGFRLARSPLSRHPRKGDSLSPLYIWPRRYIKERVKYHYHDIPGRATLCHLSIYDQEDI